MENTTLLSRLNKLIEGKTLEKARFGRSGTLMIWLNRKDLPDLARLLKVDSGFQLDWLEHLSVMQMDDLLVGTYFLRSTRVRNHLVLRTTTAVPANRDGVARMPSVREIWPMADAMEEEVGELFGIRFGSPSVSEDVSVAPPANRLVHANTRPFPLRKDRPDLHGGH